jgi:hypothetical protein
MGFIPEGQGSFPQETAAYVSRSLRLIDLILLSYQRSSTSSESAIRVGSCKRRAVDALRRVSPRLQCWGMVSKVEAVVSVCAAV